ncbi:hypothetical protein DPMN_001456 [Dreissena polymorpha]|uniref:Uncharacterized protein n=1 Tax=Dreissena polymorpha TaxID=45954 RepID=A0A9D4MJV0_DREPO|nr:hypothetical protein DPMN_001456 [Dreissena polymorpha]
MQKLIMNNMSETARNRRQTLVEICRIRFRERMMMFKVLPTTPTKIKIPGNVAHSQKSM